MRPRAGRVRECARYDPPYCPELVLPQRPAWMDPWARAGDLSGSVLHVSATLVPARRRAYSSRVGHRAIHSSRSGQHRAPKHIRLLHVRLTHRSPNGPTARMRTVGVQSLPVCQQLAATAENISYYRNSQSPEHRASFSCELPKKRSCRNHSSSPLLRRGRN